MRLIDIGGILSEKFRPSGYKARRLESFKASSHSGIQAYQRSWRKKCLEDL